MDKKLMDERQEKALEYLWNYSFDVVTEKQNEQLHEQRPDLYHRIGCNSLAVMLRLIKNFWIPYEAENPEAYDEAFWQPAHDTIKRYGVEQGFLASVHYTPEEEIILGFSVPNGATEAEKIEAAERAIASFKKNNY